MVAGLLHLFVICTLFRTSFTDPGIIPRATPDETADVKRKIGIFSINLIDIQVNYLVVNKSAPILAPTQAPIRTPILALSEFIKLRS